VPFVVGVERAQGLLVRAPRRAVVADRVVRAAKRERGQCEGWIDVERPAERCGGLAAVVCLQLDQAADEVGVGVEGSTSRSAAACAKASWVSPGSRRMLRI
jgi:hypothetical protein